MSTQPAPKQNVPMIPNFPDWCQRTEIGLQIVGLRQRTFEEWSGAFSILDKTKKGYQWHIGDMLNAGEKRWGDDCYRVIDPIEEVQQEEDSGETYRKYQQVAGRIVIGRRRPRLSFGHHQVVAFMETPEEQDAWLDWCEATTPVQSVHKLRKAIKGDLVGNETETDPDLFVLQEPEVRSYLQMDIERCRQQLHDVPESAGFLREELYQRIEGIKWQLARTVESDCDKVREAVCELLGTWQQVFNWLKERHRIISPPDVRSYLSQLVADGRITEEKDEKPNPVAKGTTSTVYKPKRNDYDDKKEEDRRRTASTA